jgi:phosphoribosylformylglycinamidine synthase
MSLHVHSLLPDYELPWEDASAPYPAHLAHPRTIAVEASNGASDYGNKYGEPVLAGFCRSFGMKVPSTTKAAKEERVEWIKPIMFTAGVSSSRLSQRECTRTYP